MGFYDIEGVKDGVPWCDTCKRSFNSQHALTVHNGSEPHKVMVGLRMYERGEKIGGKQKGVGGVRRVSSLQEDEGSTIKIPATNTDTGNEDGNNNTEGEPEFTS